MAYHTAPLFRLSRTLFCGLTLLAARAVAGPVATLVTVGPGDAIWEKFGHNMIRFEDADRGVDACFNWGLFDFDKPDFIGNFVRGRMLYTMAPLRTAPLLDEYHAQNRRVTFQRLRLSPERLQDLIARCDADYRTDPDYRYDYFKDNCSTRIRDTLNAALGGAIARATQGRPTTPTATYRREALRLMGGDFWASLGVDFASGPNTDQPLDRWAEGFLPESVAETVKAFADAPTEPWASTRPPPPASSPTRWPGLLAVGGVVASAIVAMVRAPQPGGPARGPWARRVGGWMIAVWWLASGLGGAFLLYMWLLTDHTAAYANQNLWQFSPLAWPAWLASVFRQRRLAGALARAIAVLSVVGVFQWFAGRLGGPWAQANGGFILLALPINLAVAWAWRPALTKPRPADGVIAP